MTAASPDAAGRGVATLREALPATPAQRNFTIGALADLAVSRFRNDCRCASVTCCERSETISLNGGHGVTVEVAALRSQLTGAHILPCPLGRAENVSRRIP